MYQALYRKWRPKTFGDVVGQAHITDTLRRQVAGDRLSHAYLFVGTRGTGKTSCAKILAKAVNCLDPQDGDPCGKCRSCVGIDDGSILDVLELDAASNNGVDNVRALRDEAVYSPAAVKKRVYIVDEVHMLSAAAFNALLKILEEPPAHLMFILATTELHKVPATILSRCQRHLFKRITPEDIAARLTDVAARENLTLTDSAADLLARLGDGALRDALSLLDQCAWAETIDDARVQSALGLMGRTSAVALLDAVTGGSTASALEMLDRLYADGKVMSAILEELLNLVRDTLVTALMPSGGQGLLTGGYDSADLTRLAQTLTKERLLYMADVLRAALTDFTKGSDSRIGVELCLLRLSDAALTSEPSALAARISDLEQHGCTPAVADGSAAVTAVKQAEPVPMSKPPRKPAPEPSAEAQQPEISKPPAQEPVASESPPSAPSDSSTPAAPADTGDVNDFWTALVKTFESDMSIYTWLSDPAQASGQVEGNMLTIRMKDPFAVERFKAEAISTVIRQNASQQFGSPIGVRFVLDGDASGSRSDPLDKFRDNPIFKFQ